ncbi:MAG TPA: hotdog fold thioesterase, partial [Dissulfurispiraceae bacterium]|nr:hotdog fold thioesterase [Dissulfurispiraceae bacterium]
ARHLGIEVSEVGPGKARASMQIQPFHLNSAGSLHGGAIFALADAAFAVASNSHGTLAVAINVSISYFKALKTGILHATAEEISINPKLATYLISITDADGTAVALFNGTVYRKKERLEDLVKRV